VAEQREEAGLEARGPARHLIGMCSANAAEDCHRLG
jgi:hypothetical protein